MSGVKATPGGLKSRDVDQYINEMGFEKGVKYCLVTLAEQQRALEHTQILVAQSMDQMTTIIQQFTVVAGRMKESHEDLIKKMQGSDRPDLPNAQERS